MARKKASERKRDRALSPLRHKCKCRHAFTASAKSEQRQRRGCKQYQLRISRDLRYCACITCTSIILNRRRKLTYNQGSHLLNNDEGTVPVQSLHSTEKRKGETKTSTHTDMRCERGQRRKMGENINSSQIIQHWVPLGEHVSQPDHFHSNRNPADFIFQPSTCTRASEALKTRAGYRLYFICKIMVSKQCF